MRDTTEQEKAAEFDRLSKMSEQDIKQDMKRFTLPKAEIDSKLDEKIAEHEAGVKRQIGEADWNQLTDGQKTAVLDVHYANPGGLDKFPKLKEAISNGDAREMANLSDFHGGQIEGTDYQHRNFDRLRRNKAEILGLDPESHEAYREVADAYPDHPKLPTIYQEHRELSVLRPEPRPQDGPGQAEKPAPEPGPTPPQNKEQKGSAAPGDPRVGDMVALASTPVPIVAIPDDPAPHITADGNDLWQASARMGSKVAAASDIDGYGGAVKGLQRGLNMLNDANPEIRRSTAWGDYTKQEKVAEDGQYGPQTDFGMKQALARHGEDKVDGALALGRFNVFARQAGHDGNADDLESKTASLFGDQAGRSLQKTLNQVGADERNDWQPLVEDNWIGPKTIQAFAGLMGDTDPDSFTQSFGQGLGLL